MALTIIYDFSVNGVVSGINNDSDRKMRKER